MIAVGVAGLMIVALLVLHLQRAATLILRTEGSTPVYATQADALRSPPASVMAQLAGGADVQVTKCIDVKHYFVYQVRLPDGRKGFVLDGKYSLRRDGELANCP